MISVDAYVVGRGQRDLAKCLTSIVTEVRSGRERVHALVIVRVDEDVRVVHRPDILLIDT